MIGLASCWLTAFLTTFAAEDFAGAKAEANARSRESKLCWCPPGTFLMGSPANEPDRRPDETQVKVTLSRGFWTAKFETTQGDWKRVAGRLPAAPTAELPEGDALPVGNVNFAEAEGFCRKLTDLARTGRTLPKDSSSACPPKPSGSTPAGQGPRPPLRSEPA